MIVFLFIYGVLIVSTYVGVGLVGYSIGKRTRREIKDE